MSHILSGLPGLPMPFGMAFVCTFSPLPSPLGQEQVARRWRAALSPCLTQKLRDLLNSVGTAPSAASGENKAEPWLNPGTAAQIHSNLS